VINVDPVGSHPKSGKAVALGSQVLLISGHSGRIRRVAPSWRTSFDRPVRGISVVGTGQKPVLKNRPRPHSFAI
jgi:hypothetical protein